MDEDNEKMLYSFFAGLLVTSLLIYLREPTHGLTNAQLKKLRTKYVAEEKYEEAARIRDILALRKQNKNLS